MHVLLLLLLSQSLFAQEKEFVEKVEKKPEQRKEAQYLIELFYEVPSNEFLLSVGEGRSSLQAKDKRIQFSPGSTSNIGLRFSAFNFAGQVKTDVFSNESSHVDKYGKSEFKDYKVKYELGMFALSTFYRNYKGFYADLNATSGLTVDSSNRDEDALVVKENIIIREDIESLNVGGELSVLWRIMDSHDLRAEYPTMGGFSMGFDLGVNLNYSRFKLQGNSPFVPVSMSDTFGQKASLYKFDVNRVGADFICNTRWYFTKNSQIFLNVTFGPGAYYSTGSYINGEFSKVSTSTHGGAGFGYKYTGVHNLFHLGFAFDSWEAKADEINLDVLSYYFDVNYGVRF